MGIKTNIIFFMNFYS